MTEATLLRIAAALIVAVFVFVVSRAVVRRVQRGGIGVLLVGIAIGGLLVLAVQHGPAVQSRLSSLAAVVGILAR